MNELYIIPTPIGNIKDISFRIIDILSMVDFIVCEDTRITGKILKYFEIGKKPLFSYNDHNKTNKSELIIKRLSKGEMGAFLSDAGMPAISDPGYYLIRKAIDENIKIVPVPGASAVLTALVGSGLPTDSFTFYGFLPKKKNKRYNTLLASMGRRETAIFFESPYRIEKTLNDILKIDKNREIVIARELTKQYEEFIRGSVGDVITMQWNRKGEMVLLIKGDVK